MEAAKFNEVHTETQNGNDSNEYKSSKTRRTHKTKPRKSLAENGEKQFQNTRIRKACIGNGL